MINPATYAAAAVRTNARRARTIAVPNGRRRFPKKGHSDSDQSITDELGYGGNRGQGDDILQEEGFDGRRFALNFNPLLLGFKTNALHSCHQVHDSSFPFRSRNPSYADRQMVSMEKERERKARAGFEPANRGFADLSLATWVPRRCHEAR